MYTRIFVCMCGHCMQYIIIVNFLVVLVLVVAVLIVAVQIYKMSVEVHT